LQYDNQFKQATLQDQQQQRQEVQNHQVALKLGVNPAHQQQQHKAVIDTINQLLGQHVQHNQSVVKAIEGLAKAHSSKRRTRAVRDHKGNIIGSESYVAEAP